MSSKTIFKQEFFQHIMDLAPDLSVQTLITTQDKCALRVTEITSSEQLQYFCQIMHPNLIQCAGYFMNDEGKAVLVSEYVNQKYESKRIVLEDQDFLKNLYGLIEACALLQSYGLSHGNIQPQKLFFIPGDNLVKIGDIDQAIVRRFLNFKINNLNRNFVSPKLLDILNQQENGTLSAEAVEVDSFVEDVFSLGLVMLKLVGEDIVEQVNDLKNIRRIYQVVDELSICKEAKGIILNMLRYENRLDFISLDKIVKCGGFQLKNYKLVDESLLLNVQPPPPPKRTNLEEALAEKSEDFTTQNSVQQHENKEKTDQNQQEEQQSARIREGFKYKKIPWRNMKEQLILKEYKEFENKIKNPYDIAAQIKIMPY